jgi:adenylate cyclase 10
MSSQNVQEHEVTLVNPSSISSSSSIIPITKDNRRNVTNTLQKELDMRLTAYLPAVVRRYLEKDVNQRVPDTHQITTVSMFVDVSGFTSMTESLAARGPVGAEYLGKHLNSYFQQLLRLVAGAGGDVFKFAGDAMLIFWPEYKEDTLESLLRRSIQCALRIQEHLHKAQLAPEVILSVKMGIGLGGATIAHLGGVHDGATSRMEYIAVGPALEQAFNAEHEAQPGDVICSSECWEMIHQYFEATAIEKGFWKVKQVKLAIKLCSRRPSFTRDDLQLYHRMKQYVSRAVWPYIDIHDEFWGSELRDVTVLFINLGFSEEELAKMLDARGLQRLQDAFEQVQKCIYDYEGTINKFLVDDKGSTVIAAFGLSPVTHENDAIRGILSSLAICAALGKIGLKASVGITTGTTFCGVVGHQGNRREYTVLGDIVNLSARLMQKAKLEKGGVITDERTKILSQDVLHFEERPQIMVKGKNDSIKIHRPYPRMSILMQYHLKQGTTMFPAGPNARMVKGIIISPTNSNSISNSNSTATTTTTTTPLANVMENMHQVQIKEAQRKLSLKSDFQLTNPDDLVHTEPFKKVQEKLIEKCCQVNRFSPGGAFILEGDIGVGKTIGLKSTLHPKSSWVLKEGYQILNTSASPFAGRKSYAVWADILTKAALETYERSSSTSSSSTTSPASSMPVVVSNLHLPSDKFSDNTSVGFVSPPTITVDGSIACNFQQIEEKRRHISSFIKKKIEEGAAPNTKLVKYCYLLNEILETNYEKPNKSKSMDSSTTNSTDSLQSTSRNILVQQKTEEQKSERMHLYRRRRTATTCVFESEDQPESEEMERRNDDNNAEEEEPEEQTHEEQEEQDEYRSGPYTALGAGGRRRSSNFSVKEEEIAAWFLGLLEMDLSDQQEKGQQQGEEDEENSDVDDDDYDDDDDPEEDDHENEMDQEVAEEQEQEAQRRHRSKRAGRRRSTQSIEDKTSRPTTTDDDEQEIEEVWHPKALDLEGILLLCSLHALSRQKTTIFMLDNAMYMDEKSWVIATIISKYFTNCLLVLGTRPPSKAPGGGLEHTESSSFRKQLKMLKKIPNTCNFYMEPLCLNDLELLTKHILKIYEIPNDLLSILFARSQGNPFFLKEILKEMIEQQVISVDEKLRMVKMQVQTAWDDKTYAIYCFRCAIKFLTSKDKHRCRAHRMKQSDIAALVIPCLPQEDLAQMYLHLL